MWELAAYKGPRKLPSIFEDDPEEYHIGQISLFHTYWHGVKKMDVNDPGFQAGYAYYMERDKRKKQK
jgi:hypothetical protein